MAKQATTKKIKKTIKAELKVIGSGSVKTKALPAYISESESHPALMHESVVVTLANKRVGTAWTKTRAHVRGGGKKPWRQKGTGMARHGSTRSPIWRKGGVTFGPNERIFERKMTRQSKMTALIAALKKKAQDGNLFLLSEFKSPDGKAKGMAREITKLKLKKSLIVREATDALTQRAVRNIANVTLSTAREIAAYDVLKSAECVLTQKGLDSLSERLDGKRA